MRLFGRPRGVPAVPERRTIRLDGQDVHYVLKRSSRRSFALHVDPGGVRVAVPGQAHVDEVERFITGHRRWLLDKLAQQTRRAQAGAFEVVDGAVLPLFGNVCRLRLTDSRKVCWQVAADGTEELHLPASGDVRAALVRTLRRRALPWFAGRVEAYCARLHLPCPAVRLSSARTRWGSCSARSGIRLHWRLVHLPPELVDYVVAHEVAHLVEMNHSARFWAVVGELYPDWKHARARLREAALGLPAIDPTMDYGPVGED
ncbi:MAG TPA: SprT family zinc-dependent metalloprotease [Rhodocyclaceae bacterium]|nr:SprT family zinc-dependent metalloprotease [Rhodocyclaceae bacterium]